MSRISALRAGLLVLGVTSALVVTGCSDGSVSEPEWGLEVTEVPQSNAEVIDGTVGELSAVDGSMRVGDDLTVLVDLPDQSWKATSSDLSVVEISEEESGNGTSLVRITALSAGDSLIVFESESGERDEFPVTVSE